MAKKVEKGRRSDIQLNFRLPAAIKEDVDKRASELNCSTAAFIRYCIVEKLAEINSIEYGTGLPAIIAAKNHKKRPSFDGVMKSMSSEIELKELRYAEQLVGEGGENPVSIYDRVDYRTIEEQYKERIDILEENFKRLEEEIVKVLTSRNTISTHPATNEGLIEKTPSENKQESTNTNSVD